MKNLLIALGNFFFRHRNHVFPLLMVAGVLFIRPQFAGGNHRTDLIVDLIGVLVCLYGQAMRVLAIGYYYIKRGGLNKQIYAGRLVQYGFFAHSRNPLYLGNILIFIGIVIVFSAPIAYAVGIPAVLLIYLCIILAEEQFLRGKFGEEYDAYAAKVNRLWPNWNGFGKSVEGMTFRWKRVLSKEYGTTFGWLTAVIGLRAWTLYLACPEDCHKEMVATLLMYVPLLIAYGIIRGMKKSGRLADNDLSTMDE